MTDRKATRVVLLARAGDARERLNHALNEAGADVALVADPLSVDPQDVIAVRPQAVLVALEPVVEDALERFDALLSNPDVTVIFDEADLAARRTGWDAARWTRHLAAKLNRHDDVLPPGWEIEGDWQPSPGPLPPRNESALDIATFTDEAQEHAIEVPRDDGPAAVELDDGKAGDLVLEAFHDVSDDQVEPEPDYALAEDLLQEGADDRVASSPDAGIPDAGMATDGNTLELVDVDTLFASIAPADGAPVGNTTIAATRSPSRDVDLEALEQRASGLSLADVDSYGQGPSRGAVLVEGGLGGPDAVRQLLAGIPEGFPRPVLIRLQLDGGRYERLVKQMERAARLPVQLAETGQDADAGTIYFVPPGVSLMQDQARLVFVDDEAGSRSMLAALPARDSAVLLMSGSGVSSVDKAMAQASAGMLVAGQAPEGCYDAAASTALIELGGATGTPAELATQLAERWPS
jgi:chemosensory pili system protein ChpB (putative protein-glutamate methylesterase)